MPKYAIGKHAYGISDRSGFRYRLNEMKREWTGLLVGREEWDPKHPQLEPRRKVIDPQALRNPRPDVPEAMDIYVGLPTPDAPNLKPVTGFGQVGNVTVVVS